MSTPMDNPQRITAWQVPEGGFRPYDLTAPVRPLFPSYGHVRTTGGTGSVQLGDDEDAPVLTVHFWGDCHPSCRGTTGPHKPGRMIRLNVPCNALPHCNACECGSEHEFYLTEDQATQLRDLLA